MSRSPSSPSEEAAPAPVRHGGSPALSKRLTRCIVAFSLDRPAWVTRLMVGITLVLALLAALPSLWPQTFAGLNALRVDTDPENMLSAEEPARQFHNRMKETLAVHDLVVVGVVNETHPNGVFNVASLQRIYDLTELAQTLQWPDPEDPEREVGVRSVDLLAPSTVDYIEHEGEGAVRFEWLMPSPPATEEEALEVRRRAARIPLMEGTLISPDGKALSLYLPLTSKEMSYRVYDALREKIATFEGDDQFHIAGLPVAEDAFGVEMFIQMAISAPAAMLVIFLLMLAFFRNLVLIAAPMVIAMVSVIATMALLIVSGQTVHIMSSMIPIFIMPIAVLDSVHILSDYFDSHHPSRSRREVIGEVMDKLAMPMFYTSVTTAAGFLSLSLVPIPPVQVFGVFVAFGVMIAWLLSISFIPAYILSLKEERLQGFGRTLHDNRVAPEDENTAGMQGFPHPDPLPGGEGDEERLRRDFTVTDQAEHGLLGRLLQRLGGFTQRRDLAILALALACAALGIYGMTQIRVNDNPVRWFAESHPIRVADEVLNRHFGGTYMAYLTLRPVAQETGVDDYRQALLGRLAEASARWDLSGLEQADLLADFREEVATTEAERAGDLLARLAAGVEARLDTAEGGALDLWDAVALFLDTERQRQEVFKRPEVLAYLVALQDHLLETGIVGKTVSLADFVRTVHRELMMGREEAYRIPATSRGVAQTLMSYQNSHRPHDLWRFVTPDYTLANLWVLLRSGDNRDMTAVVAAVDAFMAENPPPIALEHRWFGLTYINVIWQEKMVTGMLQALLSGFLFVLVMMALLLRSALWGLIAMVPLTLTIGVIYGVIGLVGKDYDMPVAVLSSLALGLAVDFSIHFLVRARGLYHQTDRWADLVPRMFGEPARAITRNIVVVAVGFLPLLAAPLVPYNTVGVLIAAILVASGAVTLLLLPVLLKRLEPWLFPHRDPRRVTTFGLGSALFVALAISLLAALNLRQHLGMTWAELVWLPGLVLVGALGLYLVLGRKSTKVEERGT